MSEGGRSFVPALGYRWLTRLFDVVVALTMPERRFRGLLADVVVPQASEAILEFGCGTGSNLAIMRQRAPDCALTGLDVDPDVLEIAERKLGCREADVTLDIYDGGQLPYDNESYDAAFTCLVLHHLTPSAKQATMVELYRVLRPGGRFVLADWGRQPGIISRAAFFMVQLLDGFATTADNAKGRLPGMMELAGFKDVHEKAHMMTPYGLMTYWIARKPG